MGGAMFSGCEIACNATGLAFMLLIGWDYIVQERVWSRGILLATLVFALVLPPVVDSYVRHWEVSSAGAECPFSYWRRPHRRAGSADDARAAVPGFLPVAFFDDDPEKCIRRSKV